MPERLELADGDFVDLVWTSRPAVDTRPSVLVLHGLEGSRHSPYARAILAALDAHGYRGVLLQFRGCSGEPNRLARSYHSGDTGDIAAVAGHVTTLCGRPPYAAVGYSLGGNVLLKWLAERGDDHPLTTAVAVSVPFDLAACADRLNQGASRLYQRHLVGSMRTKYLAKLRSGRHALPRANVDGLDTFWRYDDAIVAPLNGFRDAHDYYARSSCRPMLRHIRRPTLILHAENDPFVPRTAIPHADELAPCVTLELARGGGHVGFVGGMLPGRARYWLEPRILEHLDALRPARDVR